MKRSAIQDNRGTNLRIPLCFIMGYFSVLRLLSGQCLTYVVY